MVDFRFSSEIPPIRGRVKMGDARKASKLFPQLRRKVSLIITSPPYLDVTDFAEDQWLRLWFLGGPPTPHRRVRGDDRHRSAEKYWTFLSEVWEGIEPLLRPNANLVVRIGGRLGHSEIRQGLLFSLKQGLNSKFELKSERASEIGDGQVKIFNPKLRARTLNTTFGF
jgi:DNA modification methylase